MVIEIVAILINVPSNKKYFDYHLYEQLQDILPNFMIASIAGVATYLVILIGLDYIFTMLLQGIVAFSSYYLLSRLAKNNNLDYVLSLMKKK